MIREAIRVLRSQWEISTATANLTWWWETSVLTAVVQSAVAHSACCWAMAMDVSTGRDLRFGRLLCTGNSNSGLEWRSQARHSGNQRGIVLSWRAAGKRRRYLSTGCDL